MPSQDDRRSRDDMPVPPTAGQGTQDDLADRLAQNRSAQSGHDSGRRFAPRSPRLALEPERVPAPTPRSKRVRHPLVIVGNAIFMFLLLASLAIGGGLYVGKSRFEAAGP